MAYDWLREPGRQAQFQDLLNSGLSPQEALDYMTQQHIEEAGSASEEAGSTSEVPTPLMYTDPHRFIYEDRLSGTTRRSKEKGGSLLERLRVAGYAGLPYREPEPRQANLEGVAQAQALADRRDFGFISPYQTLEAQFSGGRDNRDVSRFNDRGNYSPGRFYQETVRDAVDSALNDTTTGGVGLTDLLFLGAPRMFGHPTRDELHEGVMDLLFPNPLPEREERPLQPNNEMNLSSEELAAVDSPFPTMREYRAGVEEAADYQAQHGVPGLLEMLVKGDPRPGFDFNEDHWGGGFRSQVAERQYELRTNGFPVAIDGYAGPETMNAWKEYTGEDWDLFPPEEPRTRRMSDEEWYELDRGAPSRGPFDRRYQR